MNLRPGLLGKRQFTKRFQKRAAYNVRRENLHSGYFYVFDSRTYHFICILSPLGWKVFLFLTAVPAFFFRLLGDRTRRKRSNHETSQSNKNVQERSSTCVLSPSPSGRSDEQAVVLVSYGEAEAMFEYSCNGFLCQLQRRHSCCICTMLYLTQNIW